MGPRRQVCANAERWARCEQGAGRTEQGADLVGDEGEAAHLSRGVDERDPARHDVGAVGLLAGDRHVLMQRRQRGGAGPRLLAVALCRRKVRPQVLDGAQCDLRANQRLDGVQQAAAEEEFDTQGHESEGV